MRVHDAAATECMENKKKYLGMCFTALFMHTNVTVSLWADYLLQKCLKACKKTYPSTKCHHQHKVRLDL